MVCPKCGKENAEGAAFCNACGSKMETLNRGVVSEPRINSSFMKCLEDIIEIEKRKAVQEKTMMEIDNEIEQLGIPVEIPEPQKREVVAMEVDYDPVWSFVDFGWFVENWWSLLVFGAILGVVFWLISEWFLGWVGFELFDSIIIFCAIGLLGPLLFIIITKLIVALINNSRQQSARIQQQNNYNISQSNALAAYNQAKREYQEAVAADQERLVYENSKKRTLTELLNKIEEKHEETTSLLTQFYNASGLYQTYHNLIAVSHIYEYLKSGICTKLGGIDGAYKVFKDEMYQKYQLERLDLIGSKIDQLHFDCLTLNSSLGQIAGQVSRLADSVDDFRIAYHDASLRAGNQLSQLSDRLRSFEESYAQNSAISQYNQQCIEAELNAANWLEVYKLSLDR